jgi:enoyl-CoA hydratase
MAAYQFLLVERKDRVGLVTLNRPHERNALNFQIISELIDALESCSRADEIHCIVITGAGDQAFAAGGDITEMVQQSAIDMQLSDFDDWWQRMRRIRKPLIAAVSGYALGGGCELAMHCDLIIASENARFGQPEILLGVIPGAGGTQHTARTMGKYRTMEMVLTGRHYTAQEMADHGLINRVVPQGEHLKAALELAQTIAAQPRLAVLLAKESVRAAFETTLEEGLEIERKNFFLLFASHDQQEGMQAFLEKRPAQFQGR